MKFGIKDLIKYYFKNIVFNVAIIAVMILLGYVYIFNFYKEEYVAKTTFMLGVCVHDCEEESHLNVEFNKKVLFDYMELIKTDLVLKKANDKSNLNYKVSELKEMVDVSYEEDTEYVRIVVTSNNKSDSAKLSLNLYEALTEEVDRIFDISNIHLVDVDGIGYLKTSKSSLIMMDILIGLIISVFGTIVKFVFLEDNDIKSFILDIFGK